VTVVELGEHKGGHDELLGGVAQQSGATLVIGVGGVRGGEHEDVALPAAGLRRTTEPRSVRSGAIVDQQIVATTVPVPA
jgi:hypothetical protein